MFSEKHASFVREVQSEKIAKVFQKKVNVDQVLNLTEPPEKKEKKATKPAKETAP